MLAHLEYTNETNKGSYLLQKTNHSLSPPPRTGAGPERGVGHHRHHPVSSNGVVYLPYPPPQHHMHAVPLHSLPPPDERERHSPHHAPPPQQQQSLRADRDSRSSPPSATSPRKHSASHHKIIPSGQPLPLPPPHGHFHLPPGHYYPVHPGYPVRPMMTMKRESPSDEKHSPKDDRFLPSRTHLCHTRGRAYSPPTNRGTPHGAASDAQAATTTTGRNWRISPCTQAW